MKRIFCVLIGLIFLLPCFLKAQKGKVIWERGGEISAGSFSFSPDSSEYIVGDRSSEISIRNTETDLVLRKFSLQSSDNRVTWSPRTNHLAVLTHRYIGNSPETALLLMDASDGRILQEIVPYYGDVAFSPDGKYLYRSEYLGGTTAELQDTVVRMFDFPWERFSILPGDTAAIVWEKDSLHLVSFPEGERLMTYSAVGQVWEADAELLAIETKNNLAAIVTNGNRSLKIFDYPTGKIIQQWPEISRVHQLSFSPNGEILAVGTFTSFEFLDIATGNVISSERIHSHERGFIRFAPSGNKVFVGAYSGSGDCAPQNYDRMWEPESNLLIWDRVKAERVIPERQGHHTKIFSMRFSDDFKNLTTVDSDSVAFTWETPTGELLKKEKVTEFLVSQFTTVSPSGKYKLINGSYDFELWDNTSNTLLRSLPYQKQMTNVYGRTFSPDEQYVLASLEYYYMGIGNFPPQELHIWSVPSGNKVDSIMLPCFLSHIQVSGDNRYIAGVTFDGSVIVLNGEGVLTSVENPQPSNFFKTTIHPNPVIDNGTISYSILKHGLLKVSIHDIYGREVVVLKNEFSEPGNYTALFKNSGLPNGTYFLKVTSGEEVSTTRFSIVR